MASIPSVNQFPCKSKTPRKSSENSKLITRNAIYPVNGISFSALSIKKPMKMKQNFTVQAGIEENYGPDKEPLSPGTAFLEKEPTEIEVLKKQLVNSFYGTSRGLSSSSETRAEIVELITQLEAKNPIPAPTEALTLLNGKWILS